MWTKSSKWWDWTGNFLLNTHFSTEQTNIALNKYTYNETKTKWLYQLSNTTDVLKALNMLLLETKMITNYHAEEKQVKKSIALVKVKPTIITYHDWSTSPTWLK